MAAGEFSSRSRAVQEALTRLLDERAGRPSLLGELARLDPAEGRAPADAALAADTPWPQS